MNAYVPRKGVQILTRGSQRPVSAVEIRDWSSVAKATAGPATHHYKIAHL